MGRGRIEARLHSQRLARSARAFELRAQFGFLDDLRRAVLDVCQLYVNRWKVSHVVVIIATLFVESRASSPGHDDAGAGGTGETPVRSSIAALCATRADRSSARRLPAPACDSAAIRRTLL